MQSQCLDPRDDVSGLQNSCPRGIELLKSRAWNEQESDTAEMNRQIFRRRPMSRLGFLSAAWTQQIGRLGQLSTGLAQQSSEVSDILASLDGIILPDRYMN